MADDVIYNDIDYYDDIRKNLPGVRVTSGFRTREYQQDMRRRGYKPAKNSHHLEGGSLDLVPPSGKSREWLASQLRERYPEANVLDEHDHFHVTFPGYNTAPVLGGARSAGLTNPARDALVQYDDDDVEDITPAASPASVPSPGLPMAQADPNDPLTRRLIAEQTPEAMQGMVEGSQAAGSTLGPSPSGGFFDRMGEALTTPIIPDELTRNDPTRMLPAIEGLLRVFGPAATEAIRGTPLESAALASPLGSLEVGGPAALGRGLNPRSQQFINNSIRNGRPLEEINDSLRAAGETEQVTPQSYEAVSQFYKENPNASNVDVVPVGANENAVPGVNGRNQPEFEFGANDNQNAFGFEPPAELGRAGAEIPTESPAGPFRGANQNAPELRDLERQFPQVLDNPEGGGRMARIPNPDTLDDAVPTRPAPELPEEASAVSEDFASLDTLADSLAYSKDLEQRAASDLYWNARSVADLEDLSEISFTELNDTLDGMLGLSFRGDELGDLARGSVELLEGVRSRWLKERGAEGLTGQEAKIFLKSQGESNKNLRDMSSSEAIEEAINRGYSSDASKPGTVREEGPFSPDVEEEAFVLDFPGEKPSRFIYNTHQLRRPLAEEAIAQGKYDEVYDLLTGDDPAGIQKAADLLGVNLERGNIQDLQASRRGQRAVEDTLEPGTQIPDRTEALPKEPVRDPVDGGPSGTGGTGGPPPKTPETGGGGGTPPEGPPPEIDDLISRLTSHIKAAKNVRTSVEQERAMARREKMRAVGAARKNTSGREGLYAEKAALRGELPSRDFEAIPQESFSNQEVKSLFDWLKNNPDFRPFESIHAREALDKMFKGVVPTPSEINLLERGFGKEFVKEVLKKRKVSRKLWEGYVDLANLPFALMSSFDLSAFRQGAFLITRPEFWKAAPSMGRALFSEKNYQGIMNEIRSRPTFDLMEEAGVAFSDLGVDLTRREENMASKFAEKIPGIRPSNRAYSGFLNKLRADVFDKLLRDVQKSGADFEQNPEYLKQIAEYVNDATGRGNLGRFGQYGPAFNALLFSPRLQASRINLLARPLRPSTYKALHPELRKAYFRDLAGFSAFVMTALELAKLNGAEVETDPRSSDFAKIKDGNTRHDIMAGFQQYLRLGAQLATGETKTLKGDIKELGEGYKGETRLDKFITFLRSKGSPIATFIADYMDGKNLVGEPFTFAGKAQELLLPFSVNTALEAYDDRGLPGVLETIDGLFGVGVNTFDVNAPKTPKKTLVDRIMGTEPEPLPTGRKTVKYDDGVKYDDSPEVQYDDD